MKSTLVVVAVLFLAGLFSSGAKANPKGLGPSAIEAARLKDNPPRNYLSHYLPDDRYKIAGGVWKFVSTDLDTFYHIPSSPNMLRQPADRVIGFANVREAEEAGYSADPGDGTARAVAASRPAPAGGSRGNGGSGLTGLDGDPAEKSYGEKVGPIMLESQRNSMQLFMKLTSASQEARRAGGTSVLPASVRSSTAESLRQSRNLIRRFESVRPPRRLNRLHSLISQALRASHNTVYGLNRMAATGDFSYLGQMQEQANRSQALYAAIKQESLRLSSNSR